MNPRAFFASVLQGVGQMLLPDGITCHACGGELDGTTQYELCGSCNLEFNQNFCARCGQAIDNLAEYCDRCMAHGAYHFDLARSAVVFNQTAQSLIHAFKYGSATYLADYLAGFMAESVVANQLHLDVIAFVPLHKKRLRRRGYNQSELLAVSLSESLSIPVVYALEKIRHTKNLARLSRKDREAVIAGSFRVAAESPALNGKAILFVDDVFTTGATADECAKMLKAAGAAKVTALTFASVHSSHASQSSKKGKITI